MICKMNTKVITAMAIFAMMFAGFGAVLVAEANDADPTTSTGGPTGDLTITVNDMLDEKILAAFGAKGTIKFAAAILDDAEDYVTIINSDDYKKFMRSASAETDPGYRVGANIVYGTADLTDADFVAFLGTFTTAEVNKLGEVVGGVSTQIIFADVAEKDIAVEFSLGDIATAVAKAKEGMFTKQEVDDAITAALAKVSDYIYTQADMDKAKKDAAQKAVDDYVAANPVAKQDDTFMYVAIVFIAITIVLAGLFVYMVFLKPKMAAKNGVIKI